MREKCLLAPSASSVVTSSSLSCSWPEGIVQNEGYATLAWKRELWLWDEYNNKILKNWFEHVDNLVSYQKMYFRRAQGKTSISALKDRLKI
jgi:hypothetical protein